MTFILHINGWILVFHWLLKECLDLLKRSCHRYYSMLPSGAEIYNLELTSRDLPFVSGTKIMTKTRATPTMTPYIQKTRPAPRLFLRSRKVLVTRKVPAQFVPVAREAPRPLDLLGSSSPIISQGIGPNLDKCRDILH